MKNLTKIVCLLILFPLLLMGQLTNKEIKATIKIEDNTDFISITGIAENLTDSYKSLYYKMSVIKNDKNNNAANNQQSGRFTMEANQLKLISKTQINQSKDNQIIILLLIYDENNKLLGKDRVVLGEKENKLSTKPKNDVEIIGIISNETKTKMGKDFYDYFYSVCNKIKLEITKIVVVDEEVSNVRNTIIKIRIDETIINEFASKPDEEYLTTMAEDSANKLYRYLKNLEKQAHFISHY